MFNSIRKIFSLKNFFLINLFFFIVIPLSSPFLIDNKYFFDLTNFFRRLTGNMFHYRMFNSVSERKYSLLLKTKDHQKLNYKSMIPYGLQIHFSSIFGYQSISLREDVNLDHIDLLLKRLELSGYEIWTYEIIDFENIKKTKIREYEIKI